MKKITRLLAVFMAMMILCGAMPLGVIAEEVSQPNYIELSDGYLSVKVSTKNGGFLIDTVEGNQLKKSDDNKFFASSAETRREITFSAVITAFWGSPPPTLPQKR